MPATTSEHGELLRLLEESMAGRREEALAAVGLTWEEMQELPWRLGRGLALWIGGRLAGFAWIEKRGEILHLHALLLKEECRGLGYGAQVLQRLEEEYRGRAQAIELGVHEANALARALYEKSGSQPVWELPGSGLTVMRKALGGAEPGSERPQDAVPGAPG
ncbi:MAG: hypothetical protein C4305_05725 [Thermoleophilia bacterium]